MHLDHLSSSHLEPFSTGGFSLQSRQDCLSSSVYPGGFNQTPPPSPAALAPLSWGCPEVSPFLPSSRKKHYRCLHQFSCFLPFSTWGEWIRAHLLPWWTECQCRQTLAVSWNSVPQQSRVPSMACMIPQQFTQQLLYCISFHFCFMLPLISEKLGNKWNQRLQTALKSLLFKRSFRLK